MELISNVSRTCSSGVSEYIVVLVWLAVEGRSTLSMCKIKVKISEIKSLSFNKSLDITLLNCPYLVFCQLIISYPFPSLSGTSFKSKRDEKDDLIDQWELRKVRYTQINVLELTNLRGLPSNVLSCQFNKVNLALLKCYWSRWSLTCNI